MTEQATTTDGRTRRAEAQRESRRAHILETAERVFADKGYHHTRISDIIDAAGIARGTFYLYFESKNAIFLDLLDRLLEQLRATVDGVETGPGAAPIGEQLVGLVARVVRAVGQHRALTTIILREAVGLDEEVERKLREFYGNVHAWIADSLESGRTLGLVRRDLDTSVVASCILGSIKYLLEEQVMTPGSVFDPERVGKAVLDYNLRGVLV